MKCLWQELQSTREQKNFEGGLQRLESKSNSEALCSFPFSDDFLLHTPWCLILSVGSFSYSPMLLYMGSLSLSYTPCAGLCVEHLLHVLCWFIWGVSLTHPVLAYVWSFSYTPHAGFFLLGVSLIRSILVSLCSKFLLYKTKRKNVKVNKNVHN